MLLKNYINDKIIKEKIGDYIFSINQKMGDTYDV